MPSDTIRITGLAIDCLIGVYDWEQEIKQTLLFDVEVVYDMTAAAGSDDLNDAVDYTAISQSIRTFAQQSHFQLVEALAVNTANMVLAQFPVERCCLTIHKPLAVDEAQDLSVSIERVRC